MPGMTKEDGERFARIVDMDEADVPPADAAWASRQNPIEWLMGVAEGNIEWHEPIGKGALVMIGKAALEDDGYPSTIAEVLAATSIMEFDVTGCRYVEGMEREVLEFCIDGEWKRFGS